MQNDLDDYTEADLEGYPREEVDLVPESEQKLLEIVDGEAIAPEKKTDETEEQSKTDYLLTKTFEDRVDMMIRKRNGN